MKVNRLVVSGALLVALSFASAGAAQKPQPEQPAGQTAPELLTRSLANPLRDQVEQAIQKREYPRAEKLLIEATLELIARRLVVSVQDLGAAGITCATCEAS